MDGVGLSIHFIVKPRTIAEGTEKPGRSHKNLGILTNFN